MRLKISSKNLLTIPLIITIIALIISTIMIAGCVNDTSTPDSYANDSDSIDLVYDNASYENSTSSPDNYEKKGYCTYVVDGDTIDVEGVGRIRLVGVNTPERGQDGYQEAKNFVKSQCLNKMVYLDIDDKKNYDKYDRVLAVVYVDDTNLNAQLLNKGLAEIMYIPPSEFNPYLWV